MDKYIERDAAINAVFEAYADGRSAYIALKEIPAEDVAPVVHGHWIKSPEEEEFDICSVCGKYEKHRSRANWEHDMIEFFSPFCPNCGADMREVDDG